MRAFACACLSALALAAPVQAASGAVPAPLVLRLSVLGPAAAGAGSDLTLNVGSVSAPGRKRPIVLRERVAVRLEGSGGSARLSVALAQEMPGCIVRVDGQTITSLPRVIDPVHRIGSTVVHQLEMSIDPGVPAGAFLSNLLWVAEND